MPVPAPNLQNKSIQELFDELHSGEVGSPMHQQAMFMLQFRVTERQAKAAAQQAAAAAQQAVAAQQMVAPTQALANFTRLLVRATWALFFVAGATVLLTIVQVALAVARGGAR
jgi:hypothetical protein